MLLLRTSLCTTKSLTTKIHYKCHRMHGAKIIWRNFAKHSVDSFVVNSLPWGALRIQNVWYKYTNIYLDSRDAFTHIFGGCFNGSEAITRLFQGLWSKSAWWGQHCQPPNQNKTQPDTKCLHNSWEVKCPCVTERIWTSLVGPWQIWW